MFEDKIYDPPFSITYEIKIIWFFLNTLGIFKAFSPGYDIGVGGKPL